MHVRQIFVSVAASPEQIKKTTRLLDSIRHHCADANAFSAAVKKYSSDRLSRVRGGCLGWNPYRDFGSGQIGDMGSHMLDMAFWGFDLTLPTTCQAEGTEVNPDTCPQWLKAEWDHPANDWRPAVK